MVRTNQQFGWLLLMQTVCITLGFSLIVCLPVSAILVGVENTLILGMGFCALLVLVLPVLHWRDYDIFQPLSFVILTSLLGITLNSLYIIIGNNEHVYYRLLVGKTPNFLFAGYAVVFFGLFAFMFGYMLQVPSIQMRRFSLLRKDHWNNTRLLWVSIIGIIVAIIGIILFVRTMGIGTLVLTLTDISRKRFYVVEGAEFQHASLGYHRWAASLIGPVFYVFLTWFAASEKRWLSVSGVIAACLGLFATLFPLFTSSRTGVVVVPIVAIMIWHYIRKEILVGRILLAVAFVVLIIMIMTGLRASARSNDASEVRSYLTGEKFLEVMAGSMHFFNIAKTAHIVEAVPTQLEYQYGRTFILWLFAPIPRTMWPQKPIIGVGEIVGKELFEARLGLPNGGIPPGFIGELYWNFGFLGVPVGMFLLGCFLKLLYNSFRNILRNKNAVLIYSCVVIPTAFLIPGENFSGSIIMLIMNLIPMLVILRIINKS